MRSWRETILGVVEKLDHTRTDKRTRTPGAPAGQHAVRVEQMPMQVLQVGSA